MQDGVLNVLKKCNTPFFLTGGTALSRAYYNHRYSDDLDFFIVHDSNFSQYVEVAMAALKNSGFTWDEYTNFVRDVDFVSLFLIDADKKCFLKIDFINDVSVYFGKTENTTLFFRTDNVRNILSNKITALFRYSPKDIADIREIALHEKFNWIDILNEARQKEDGIDLSIMAEIINGIPETEFNSIKWIKETEWAVFRKDIDKICYDILAGGENSLAL
jgi:predicted nucleotidyltransferase component of viral defense system